MNTVDMTVPVMNQDGAPMKDSVGIVASTQAEFAEALSAAPAFTIGRACSNALNSQFEDEKSLSWEEKWARTALAARIKEDAAAILSSEEVSAIKKVVGKLYTGLIIAQVFPAVDPNVEVPKIK